MDIKLSKNKIFVGVGLVVVIGIVGVVSLKAFSGDTHESPAQAEEKKLGPEEGVSRKGLLSSFDARSECKACGADKKYFVRNHIYANKATPKTYNFVGKEKSEAGEVAKNHFDVKCSKCRMSWLERVKNDPWNNN